MNEVQDSLMDNDSVYEVAEEYGEEGADIPISVSFRIVKQFSEELYDNPRRAIEELVCNSYDAGATECHITTPSKEQDELKVLDNGESMDVEGLEWLWKVAESRKAEELGDDRVKNGRKQIGKFGVGKLAAFALGSRLTHVATKNGVTRVISVHQNELKDVEDDEPFTVQKFDSSEAEDVFQHHFENIPNPWEKGWEEWTLAVISDIPDANRGNDLRPWLLKQMIPSAVPSQSEFTTYLNDEPLDPVEPPADVDFTVDVTSEGFIDSLEDRLKRFWSSRKEIDKQDVSEELYRVETEVFDSPGDSDEELAGIHVPRLGNVHGEARYYDEKLTTQKRAQRDYDEHGFRVFVRGRLVNKNDITFGLDNLSHKTWIRFRSELEIPALDEDLRVQRDSTKDSLEVAIAKIVVRQTFNKVRQQAREEEEGEEEEDSLDMPFSDRLKLRSPWYGPHAITGLAEERDEPIELDDIDIRVTSLRSTDNAVEFDSEDASFLVNDSHPLFDTLERKGGFTKHIEDAFSEILAARLLIHGYLRYNGADPDALAASRQIFDSVLRSAAGSLGEDELSYQLRELREASEVGGTRFEVAFADILQNIGLAAVQEGGPDTHDGVVTIPRTAEENRRISIEAKGSQGIVDHNQLSFDNVNRHRVEQDCHHAVVVAREFKTDGIGDKKSALLRNADGNINDGVGANVSFLPTEAIEAFLRLHYAQPFTYSELIDILTNEEHPDNVLDYVVDTWESKPDDQLTRRILTALHEFIEEDDTNSPGIGTLIGRSELRGTPREDISEKLEALDNLCDSVTLKENGIVEVDAPPETIIEEVDEARTNAEEVLRGPDDREQITDYS